jgi:hypothetical protein
VMSARIWRRDTQHWLPAQSSQRIIRVVLGVERGKKANCTAREGRCFKFKHIFYFFFFFFLSSPPKLPYFPFPAALERSVGAAVPAGTNKFSSLSQK